MRSRPCNSDLVIDSRDVIDAIAALRSEIADLTHADEIADLQDVLDTSYDPEVCASTQAQIDALRDSIDDDHVDGLREELEALEEFAADGERCATDWKYGETLILDSHFEEYAQELAEDCGMIQNGASWPYTCIDWEQAARELQMDYSPVEFAGVTYWTR